MWLCSLSSSRDGEGRRRWEACLGCSIWTENSLWSVARGNFLLGEWRESITIRRGSGFQPCLCREFAL